MNRKTIIGSKGLFAILLAACLFIAACGSTSNTASSSAAESTAKAVSAEASAAAEEKAVSEAPAAEAETEETTETASISASASAEEAVTEEVSASEEASQEAAAETSSGKTNADLSEAPEIGGLTAESVLPLSYAKCFNLFYYSDGYKFLDVPNSAQYLIVPEGKEAPDGLDDSIIILQEPFNSIYLAATSAMALFDAIDAIDHVTMSGTTEGGWYIDAPMEALEAGEMVYAGKYSEPDYETMIALECDLAIESTMILHTPEVQEMIEDLGIPVFIDRSAYETEPLGRTEWVKLYGALLDKDDEANAFFAEQEEMINGLEDFQNTGLTVAYFSVNTDGSIVVRTNNDYIPSMIDLAGGKYIFDGMFEGIKSSTSAISMEQFYSTAHDADFLIYNATIENPLENIEALIAKNSVFADFKAVKEGNVWQVGKVAYQSTDKLASLILDFNRMLTGADPSEMVFLTKVD